MAKKHTNNQLETPFNGGKITDPLKIDNNEDSWQVGADDDWHTTSDGRTLTIYDPDGNARVKIQPHGDITVFDSDLNQLLKLDVSTKFFEVSPGGTLAFRIDSDGSVHIK